MPDYPAEYASKPKLPATGLSRPGGALIVSSFVAGVVLGIIAAFTHPGQTTIQVDGPAAIPCLLAILAIGVCYVLGFIKYAASKGYSGWIGFFLCLAQFIGFIVLLLLPDRKSI